MSTLAALGLICALLQDKPPVTIAPDAPTDTAWPVSGKVVRPNGTVVRISAVRVERRWEPDLGLFREFTTAESRLMKSAEVDGRAFRANLKFGPTGVYDISVNESEQRLQTERHLLGHPMALVASERKAIAKMMELCDRATGSLEEIQKVLAGKQPGTVQAKEAFIKKIYADEQVIQELSMKTDLTGSAALLNEIFAHIRNAQVWGQPGGKASDEQTNDGEGVGRDIFLDPKLNFKLLQGTIESARTVLSRELILSTATILDALFARAEGRPEKVFQKAKDIAIESIQLLSQAPVEDKEARAVIEAAAGADASAIVEVRKNLKSLAAKHRIEAP